MSELDEKDKTIRKLARMVKDNETKANDEIRKRDEEIKNLHEKIKNLEKRSDDVFKQVTTGNYSEVKAQYEKESLRLNETLKILRNNVEEKNENIAKSRDEMNELRLLIQEERKKNDSLLSMNRATNPDLQFYKIVNENSSHKTKLLNAEEKIEKLLETIEKLKADKIEVDKNNKINIDLIQSELNFKNNSYKQLIQDYENTNKVLQNNLEQLKKANYFSKNYEEEFKKSERRKNEIEKELIEIKSQSEGLKMRLKGNESELEINRKKIIDYEFKLDEYRLSKQVFDITYYYMSSLPVTGRIIMMREGENFVLSIENRTSSRKCSFLEIDILKDNKDATKIYLRFLRENTEEEYFTNEIDRLLEFFNDFKRRAIESNEINKKRDGKDRKVNDKLKDMFKI
jgi:hypothetical protein